MADLASPFSPPATIPVGLPLELPGRFKGNWTVSGTDVAGNALLTKATSYGMETLTVAPETISLLREWRPNQKRKPLKQKVGAQRIPTPNGYADVKGFDAHAKTYFVELTDDRGNVSKQWIKESDALALKTDPAKTAARLMAKPQEKKEEPAEEPTASKERPSAATRAFRAVAGVRTAKEATETPVNATEAERAKQVKKRVVQARAKKTGMDPEDAERALEEEPITEEERERAQTAIESGEDEDTDVVPAPAEPARSAPPSPPVTLRDMRVETLADAVERPSTMDAETAKTLAQDPTLREEVKQTLRAKREARKNASTEPTDGRINETDRALAALETPKALLTHVVDAKTRAIQTPEATETAADARQSAKELQEVERALAEETEVEQIAETLIEQPASVSLDQAKRLVADQAFRARVELRIQEQATPQSQTPSRVEQERAARAARMAGAFQDDDPVAVVKAIAEARKERRTTKEGAETPSTPEAKEVAAWNALQTQSADQIRATYTPPPLPSLAPTIPAVIAGGIAGVGATVASAVTGGGAIPTPSIPSGTPLKTRASAEVGLELTPGDVQVPEISAPPSVSQTIRAHLSLMRDQQVARTQAQPLKPPLPTGGSAVSATEAGSKTRGDASFTVRVEGLRARAGNALPILQARIQQLGATQASFQEQIKQARMPGSATSAELPALEAGLAEAINQQRAAERDTITIQQFIANPGATSEALVSALEQRFLEPDLAPSLEEPLTLQPPPTPARVGTGLPIPPPRPSKTTTAATGKAIPGMKQAISRTPLSMGSTGSSDTQRLAAFSQAQQQDRITDTRSQQLSTEGGSGAGAIETIPQTYGASSSEQESERGRQRKMQQTRARFLGTRTEEEQLGEKAGVEGVVTEEEGAEPERPRSDAVTQDLQRAKQFAVKRQIAVQVKQEEDKRIAAAAAAAAAASGGNPAEEEARKQLRRTRLLMLTEPTIGSTIAYPWIGIVLFLWKQMGNPPRPLQTEWWEDALAIAILVVEAFLLLSLVYFAFMIVQVIARVGG